MNELIARQTKIKALPRSPQRHGRYVQTSGDSASLHAADISTRIEALETNLAAPGSRSGGDIELGPGERIVCGDAWLAYDPDAGQWITNKPIVQQ